MNAIFLLAGSVTVVLMLAALAMHHAQDAPDEDRRTDHDMRTFVSFSIDQLRMRILSPQQVDNYMFLRGVPPSVRQRVLDNAELNGLSSEAA